jgi:hypothetical protein
MTYDQYIQTTLPERHFEGNLIDADCDECECENKQEELT